MGRLLTKEEKEIHQQIALHIFNLLKELHYLFMLHPYQHLGILHFSFKGLKINCDCQIKQNEDNTYYMIIYKIHNMVQSTILKELDNIKEDELVNTFKRLRNELTREDVSPWDSMGIKVRNKF